MHRSISILIILVVVFLFVPISNSQDKLYFFYDYGLFRNDDNRIIIEFYYAFDQSDLTFLKSGNIYSAAGQILLQIDDKSSGNSIFSQTYKIPVELTDTSVNKKMGRLIGQFDIILDSGSYILTVKASDFNNPTDTIISKSEFKLFRFPDNKPLTSSLQVATNIVQSLDTKSVFYKNTLEVEPNPSNVFGNNFSKVFYYVELYNLSADLLGSKYMIRTDVLDSMDNSVLNIEKTYTTKNNSKVEYGSFDISNLATGLYKLVLKLYDHANSLASEVRKPFFVYNSTKIVSVVTDDLLKEYLQSEYYKFTEEQLLDDFEKANYIMSQTQIDNYEKLNDIETKRRFMFSFWKAFDPNTLTPINEFKSEYYNRIKYSNKNFKSDFNAGWKTDRGRVYCKYGKPDDIERHPFEGETRAYEIWKYDNIEGGVQFVFVDLKSDNGDYSLVHSTKQGELHDTDWQRRIKIK